MAARGFTLLEVLISMAILVIAIAAILPLFAVGSTSLRRGMDHAAVGLLSSQILARLEEGLVTDVEAPPKVVKDATILHQRQAYRYDATFAPLDPRRRPCNAFIVKVTVRTSDAAGSVVESFDTILLRKSRR